MHEKEYISATSLAKRTSATLEAIDKGEVEKMIVLKNNSPKAVLLSMQAYEAMQEEIEDLRLTAMALARLESFDRARAVSHEKMMEKFSQ